jgi:hypothetical protein
MTFLKFGVANRDRSALDNRARFVGSSPERALYLASIGAI